jgi:hypothetical protein
MSTFSKIATKAAFAGGIALAALTAAAPADAGVAVGVRLGGPGYHHNYCYRHPHHCGRPVVVGGPAVVVGPSIGAFYHGRGWWDGHRYWAHRERWHGHWRYR